MLNAGDHLMSGSKLILCAALLALTASGAHAHLLITEVGYDPVDETSPTAEFVEILNPGPAPVSLANIWLANGEDANPLLVNGPITQGITSGDFVYRFPDIVLDPGRIVVVCHDSDAFLAEHFSGGPLSFFTGQPGQPILLEITDDGTSDGVPAMIEWGSYTAGTMSMANNGESVGLVEWDGASDLVQDHDWVCWLSLTYIPNKDVDFPFGIDGPDPDFDGSFFLEDLGSGLPAPDAPEGMSIHRTSLAEPGETTSGGNGIDGHDETTEDWSVWEVGAPTPGRTSIGVVGIAPGSGPEAARLMYAFPNPSHAGARLEFSIPTAGHVRLAVYDIHGRKIATVADDTFPAGIHSARWNGRAGTGERVEPGIYLVRFDHANGSQATPLVILR
jgi:hypothetical protein